MKSTHDPFDDELKNRLTNYSEEPDDNLWSGIASNIETVKPPVAWTKWLSIGSLVVVITGTVLYFSWNTSARKDLAEAASASLAETTKQGTEKGLPESSNESQDQNEPTTVTEQLPAGQATVEREGNDGSPNVTAATIPEQNINRVQSTDRLTRTNAPGNSQGVRSNSPASVADNTRVVGKDSEMISGNTASSNAERNDVTVTGRGDDSINKKEVGYNEQVVLNNESLKGQKDNGATLNTAIINIPDDSVQAKVPAADSRIAAVIQKEKEQNEKEEGISEGPEKKGDELNVRKNTAKETNGRPKSNRKLSLYLTAMPTFGYQRIEANQNDNVFIESISKVSNFSAKRLGVRAEIGAEYALSGKWRAFGGILYYQRKQTIDYIERVPINNSVETDVDTLVILQPEFTSKSRTFEYELRNIGIQLGVNYVLKEKKFLHTIGTGVELHKALNKLPEDQQALGFSSNPSTYVFANLYYRLQYPAQGRLRAVFQPTFNYSLYLNQDMNAPFFVKPYGLGLNVGVTYHF